MNKNVKRRAPRRDLAGIFAIAAGTALLVSAILRENRRLRFRGASVIVTGGSRGLGLEIARVFAREGARLTLLARDRQELESARRELISLGGYVMIRVCDISDRQQVQEAVEFVIRERGRVDVLINNAGIIQVGPFENTSVNDMEENFDVYVRGPLFLIKAVAPYMRRQGGGRIVNISSIAGMVAIPHLAAYSAAKSAETALSDAVRAEFARDNIRVTTVIPGLLRTGSYDNALYTGRQNKEYSWFALSGALPLLALNAEKAAHRIVEACRYGDPVLILSVQARLLRLMNALLPGTAAGLMKLAARMLPGPAAADAGRRTGRQSRMPGDAAALAIRGMGKNIVKRNLEQRTTSVRRG